MKMTIFHLSILILAVVPLYFIWNTVYRDGVLGRAFLSCISGSAWLGIFDWIDSMNGEGVLDPSRVGVAMTASFAGFLLWHLYRFHTRVIKREAVRMPPGCPADRRKAERRFTVSA